MRKRAPSPTFQPDFRLRAITFVAFVLLVSAWLSAPFMHAHHDDGQHPFTGYVVHAHVQTAAGHGESDHHEANSSGLESQQEHGTSIDAFTVEAADVQHALAAIASECVSIEPKQDRLLQPAVFPRAHGPPPDWSRSPRSPPVTLI